MRSLCTTVLIALIAACTSPGGTGPGTGSGSGKGDGSNHGMVDAAVPPPPGDSALKMQCGHPGDMGNELGVGHYCDSLVDCFGLKASLCATLGDANAHFCTKTCTTAGSTTECGTNATCECQGGQCGCTPNICL